MDAARRSSKTAAAEWIRTGLSPYESSNEESKSRFVGAINRDFGAEFDRFSSRNRTTLETLVSAMNKAGESQ
jgi:hypothetical protein